MSMPEWVMPALLALGGGTGLGALINALVNAKSSTFEQLQAVTTTLQAERTADREKHAAERLEDRQAVAEQRIKHDALDTKVNGLQVAVTLYADWAETLLTWGRAGAPPPEPIRPAGLISSIY